MGGEEEEEREREGEGERDEEEGRRSQGRQEGALFMVVEGRGHEHVDRRGDHRKRDEAGTKHRELELREEVYEQRGVDEL